MANRVDGAQGEYVLMDYCKFGTLESQLMKAAVDMPPDNTERWLPEPVLWRIFDCLVKGCMAMQCPPRYVPGNAPPAPPPLYAPGAALAITLSAIIAAVAAAAGAPNAFPNALAVLAAANAPSPVPVRLPTSGGNLPEVVAPGVGVNAGHQGMVHFDLVGSLLIYLEPVYRFSHKHTPKSGGRSFHHNLKLLFVPCFGQICETKFRAPSFLLPHFLVKFT